MRKRVSIKDVAREAGVSVTTASYVLNRKPGTRISDETARKVRAAAKRLKYVPNISARTMISQKSQLIGVIIPQTGPSHRLMFDNPFYGEFLSAVEYELREQGYHLLLSGTGPYQDYSCIAQMRSLDGIIIMGTYPSNFLEEIKQLGIPVVLVDSYIEDQYFHRVNINDRYGGYLAAKYLIDKGHRRIAFVAEKLREQGVLHERFLGYRDALAEAGITFAEQWVYEADVSYQGGFEAAEEIVRRGNGETAAFAAADIIAVGLINGLKAQHVAVPEELSVIGFDDVPLAVMSFPELTTVHQDVWEKGRQAARIVIEAGEGGKKRDVTLPLKIVERESVQDIKQA
ncbi:MAG: LacI family DNA-binding transcriptional regulator [Limnochordia bacterium]